MQEAFDRTATRPAFTAGDRAGQPGSRDVDLDNAIAAAVQELARTQSERGYWCFELEADCTIPAEYILMMHYMDEIDPELERGLAQYLRDHQGEDGGWPLYQGGQADISCTVKAYYALKLAGDSEHAPHMSRARQTILGAGGAARANVFTRIALALFQQIPWRGVPFIPVEVMLLPRWFPFHLSKVSYWSRTVMVPLLILCSLKPRARNPRGVHIRELFVTPPEHESDYFPVRSRLNRMFLRLDSMGRKLERFIPRWVRRRALRRAEVWFTDRLNGTGGLGAIFPAMVNAYEAMDCLGYPPDHPHRVTTRRAIDDLLVQRDGSADCQPCVSPVWDTALASLALQETDGRQSRAALDKALGWLGDVQLLDSPGDWRDRRPDLPGGGWAFQFRNDYYPDIDDTSAVGWAMDRSGDPRYDLSITRAAHWVAGMQSRNGGFAAFDVDNTYYYLNEIPFADHGALLDPPTADVTARSLALLSRLNKRDGSYRDHLAAAMEYLRSEQESDGAWFGRWGTNYIYGTWSVLVALEVAGVSPQDPAVQRAVHWLKSVQRPDGSWGETNESYFDPQLRGRADTGTAFQTAWALLGLMAAGETAAPEVRAGIDYLLRTQNGDGVWEDPQFTAPGFPRVFYLKYHGYSKYFPLWALARYRNLTAGKL
ncbi:MAG: squalene--hopene cyclase [Gammaproteobacteria bacterium]